jgi:putative Mg2+ transporter-C (MgtC) family protein
MNGSVSFAATLAFFLRIVFACLCGAAVGVERSKRFKEAGIRTHCVVACAAAVFMVLSKYCFADLALDAGEFFAGTRGADPARIAAQVVSGLGFLGAGVIFKNGNSIKGLTTAAGLWATAGIGMAIGSGMYLIGIFTTIILVVVQILTHKFTVGNDSYFTTMLVIVAKDSDNFHEWLADQLDAGMQIAGSSFARNENGTITYHLTVRTSKTLEFSQLLTLLDAKGNILSASIAGE